MRHAALCTLAVLFVALPAVCRAHTLTVDCEGGADYLTIQEAVNAASGGDTIAIAACVYEEQVIIPDIQLVLVGEGAYTTQVTWSGSGAILEFAESPLTVRDLTVKHASAGALAISWDEGRLTLEDCIVVGRVAGGYYYGAVDIRRCDVTRLSVCGGFRTSTVERSQFERAGFSAPWQTCHTLSSSGSSYGRLVPCFTQCFADTIGYVRVCGGYDSAQSLQAEECSIDTCFAALSPPLELDNCTVGKLMYGAWESSGPFIMRGCLVTGDVLVADWLCAPLSAMRSPGLSSRSENYLEHNTVLGGFTIDVDPFYDWPAHVIRSNIVVGSSAMSCSYPLTVSHNDFVGGLELNAPGADVFANISEDPQFCDAHVADYTIHENSPCNGAAHDGSVIGAFPVGCYVPVERASWGEIKARFR